MTDSPPLPLRVLSVRLVALFVCAGCLLPSFSFARERALSVAQLRQSVVKIHVTAQRENYGAPWQPAAPSGGTGSGFIIKGNRILSNAHVVSDARYILVQKEGDARRYRARVAFAAHDCDLAMLDVEDESFYEGTRAAPFADALPQLNDTVTVLGYPMGGDRMSITRGVVSRIDYSRYSHSGIDEHLVLQVDAAINPGNSGGPVTYEGRVIGLAFQGLTSADNIGYAIPLPVLRRFLDDVDDGHYHGYPELGVGFLSLENAALRKDLGMRASDGGVVVNYIDPFGAARETLETRDVLMAIDGHRIGNDGSVRLNGNHVLFAELLERKQWGDSILFDVMREGRRMTITVPLRNLFDPFAYRNTYDTPPDYLIVGGLVFSPLSRGYMGTLGRNFSSARKHQLLYHSSYAKVDGLVKGRQEFVVYIRRLPHPVNAYAAGYQHGIVDTVNGRKIGSMEDLQEAVEHPDDGFHVIQFVGGNDPLIMDAAAIAKSEREILKTYAIPSRRYLGGGAE